MKEAKKPCYKYCMVPMCKNNIKNTPDKVYFRIPTDVKLRGKWCKMMRRNKVSTLSSLHCCEDHFDIKEDTSNYMEYNIMKQQGEKCSLRLKKGVVPHMFLCQNRNIPPPVARMGAVKRQRLRLVNEALSEYTNRSSHYSETCEPSQRNYYEISPNISNVCDINQAGPSTSLIEICDDHQVEPKTSYTQDNLVSDKAGQVNVKPKYRSKSVNVTILTEKKNIVLSTYRVSADNIGTSPMILSVSKRKLFTENPPDSTSISSYSVTTADYEPSCSSNLSSMQNDSDDEKHFKNFMCSSMLYAIEKEPKMLLGL